MKDVGLCDWFAVRRATRAVWMGGGERDSVTERLCIYLLLYHGTARVSTTCNVRTRVCTPPTTTNAATTTYIHTCVRTRSVANRRFSEPAPQERNDQLIRACATSCSRDQQAD